jgi:predicted DNA-binding protein
VPFKTAIPVRFSIEVAARLNAVSKRTGIPISQLIRIATEQYLEKIESSQSVTIPLRETPASSELKKKPAKPA